MRESAHSSSSTANFKQRLVNFLWEPGDPETAISLMSLEGIKHVFDVVRNFGLITLIGFGATAIRGIATNANDLATRITFSSLAIVLYVMSIFLIFLNVSYLHALFERNAFLQTRKHPLVWSVLGLVLSFLLGFLLLLAAVLARRISPA